MTWHERDDMFAEDSIDLLNLTISPTHRRYPFNLSLINLYSMFIPSFHGMKEMICLRRTVLIF